MADALTQTSRAPTSPGDFYTTPVLASGDEHVALNVTVTPTGVSGSWAAGIYSKVVYGTDLLSQGYLDAAELEILSTNTSPCYAFPLCLNFNSAVTDPHSAFIAFRDYGAADCENLFYLGPEIEADVGTKASVLFSTNVAAAASHHLRIMIGATVYYIMLNSAIS